MLGYLHRNHRLLMLALFIWALGEGIWYVNLRQLYLVELGATTAQVGVALALEAVARALLPIPAGYLSDRFGARTIMISSWFLGIVGTLVGALARTWQMFVPGLVIYAMSAFAVPSLNAYSIHSMVDRKAPGAAERVLTTIFAGYSAGLVLSPAVGGAIANRFGIRTCLWLSVGIFALSTAVVLLTGPARAPHTEHAYRPLDLLHNRRFIALCIYYPLVYMALLVGVQLIPNFLQDVRLFSFASIGLLFSFLSAGSALISLIAGRLNPRWSFAATLAVCWLALLGVWHLTDLRVLCGMFFALGAIYTVRALAAAGVSHVADGSHQALAFGVVETLFSLATALASWLAGHLYGLTPARDLPFAASLIALLPMIALWFVVRSWLVPARGPLDATPVVTSAD